MKSKNNFLPYIEVTLAVIIWGASFIATKISLKEVSPLTVVWMRFGIGTIILGSLVLTRIFKTRVTLNDIIWFSLLGLIGITLHQWIQSTGLVTAKATTSAWIITAGPAFIAIFSVIVLKEKLGWMGVSGIIVATVGVVVVITKGNFVTITGLLSTTLGDFLVLISSFYWATFSVVSRRLLLKFSPSLMVFYVMLSGWLFSTIPWTISGQIHEIADLSLKGHLGIFLGIFCSGIAYIFWYNALKKLTAAKVGSFLYVEPFVAAIVASLLLGEQILIMEFLGGFVILFGVWLINNDNAKSTKN